MMILWAAFTALIIGLLALDLGVFHRRAHRIDVKEAAGWTVMWIAIGLAFSAAVYFIYENHWFGSGLGKRETTGLGALSLYITGYFLEKSLSVDNIFVIALICRHFQIKSEFQHRVLYYGILGAIISRALMIFGGVVLLERFDWLFYVFGGYLVVVGVKMLLPDHGEVNPENSWYVKGLRKVLPLSTADHGKRFFVRINGKLYITTMFLVLVVVELTDVVFAVDSVPAVLAISTDPFIVLTSNIFAILGLRSLYFVLVGMMDKFRYLKYSLAVILSFIGLKMITMKWIHIPTLLSLGVILAALVVGIIGSWLMARRAEHLA